MTDPYVSPDEELGEGRGDAPPPRSASLMDSAKRMLATVISMVHTRLELFTTEIEEEIQRAASILM